MRIFAFSILFGWFTPIFLSSKNPVMIVKSVNFYFQKPLIHSKIIITYQDWHVIDYYIPSSKYESTRFPPSFLMIWMASKFPLPWNFEKNQTSVYIKPYVSNVITNQWTLTRNPRQIINNFLIMTNQFTTVPVQVNYACHSIYFTSINYEIWQVTTVTIDIWHPYNLVSPGKNH